MNRWHVKVDNKGNIDQGDIAKQLEQKANQKVGQFKTGCIISIVMAVVVFLILAVLGIYLYIQFNKAGGTAAFTPDGTGGTAAANGAPTVVKWDGKSTYSCAGNDNVVISGVTANVAAGPGISALGNCHLTLTNVNITADTGINAMGNPVVTMTGGSITAKTASINAMGNANVTVSGAKVTGKVMKLGNATVTGAQ